MAGISTNPWVIFLLINVILFVLGTFMDMASTILICTPIFLPIAMKYGMDPVQFGMVMLINCALGLNTPPVGTTQFVGCAIGGISVGEVMRTIWPFYGALIAALLLVTYVPAFSLALPRLLMGYGPLNATRRLEPDDQGRACRGAERQRRPHPARRRCSSAASTCARPAARSRWQPLHAGEDVMHGDLRDPAVVDRLLEGVDVLIHMAGTSVERPLPEIIENNLSALHAGLRGRAPARRAGASSSPAPTTRSACTRSKSKLAARLRLPPRRLLRPVARCGARRWRACTGTSTASRASRCASARRWAGRPRTSAS